MSERTLILIRHAHARSHSGSGDHGRDLSKGGIRQAQELGAKIAQHISHIDMAAISDAQRTRRTFEEIAPSLSIDQSWTDRNVYLCGGEEIIDLARTFEGDTAMVVGHEPSISSAGYLLAPTASDDLWGGVPTATALILRFNGEWSHLTEGSATLAAFLHCPRRSAD
ncbi:MAG: histidine phosphatase family protein [Actinomycetaceae bacterium]|nr:histidine phosphatase family protein [Actinomycetaceae bacterium]